MLAFFRCRRLPYLDRVGPIQAKLPPEDLLEQWRRDRQTLVSRVFEQFPGERIEAGNGAVLAAMSQGVQYIYGGGIQAELFIERVIERAAAVDVTALECETELSKAPRSSPGIPDPTDPIDRDTATADNTLPAEFEAIRVSSSLDLLIRDQPLPTKSQPSLRHFYLPAQIRIGKRPKPEYELLLALQAELLGTLQGTTPKRGILILKGGKWHPIHLGRRREQVRQLIREYLLTLDQPDPPQVFMARSRCHLCHWREHCRQLNATSQPLSLLPGVTGSRYPLLQEAGIESVEALANAHLETLQAIPKLGAAVALQLKRQAHATLTQQPVWIQQEPFPKTAVEIYFDIEADPRHNVAYLLGLLVVEQTQDADAFRYHSCLATTPEEEGQVWQQFLRLTAQHPEAPIYHFHGFEVQTCQRLGQQYNTDPRQLRQLLKRFVDLHEWVQRSVVLPIESYSLKNIARWLGFEWRIPDASGAQSIYWYSQWLETQDRDFLERSVIYNEDDCRATHRLKDWLAKGADSNP
ncbi:TM0106 family RecB-like putative nuclease [Synechococcus bigranulatus str. 'Rupite']|uniref:TM0106 family RecB-like putative nuclease n=1 Tax=Thermostichus vulcanus str. 'Rupite' TaxID=2813851 RepID=A0ABT0C8N7_THEVL|nr:TM0106 family RecB-like putative nuclease [Thermostichus vulcanus str. 'Rupite']